MQHCRMRHWCSIGRNFYNRAFSTACKEFYSIEIGSCACSVNSIFFCLILRRFPLFAVEQRSSAESYTQVTFARVPCSSNLCQTLPFLVIFTVIMFTKVSKTHALSHNCITFNCNKLMFDGSSLTFSCNVRSTDAPGLRHLVPQVRQLIVKSCHSLLNHHSLYVLQ